MRGQTCDMGLFPMKMEHSEKTRHINMRAALPPYQEFHRPQFHFTARRGWLNDPNGLVYHDGEYHLFFQHNPKSVYWGDLSWGHAVSTDLLHWKELPPALYPDELGTIFSGSAVEDTHNTSGFQDGPHAPLVAVYTSAGAFVTPKRPYTQSIAFSTDRGRTWKKYGQNPVLPHVEGNNRDPRVFWHDDSQHWVMVLYLADDRFGIFRSSDVKTWEQTSEHILAADHECPDLFELPIDNDPSKKRWVFWGGHSSYQIGSFNGTHFIAESDVHQAQLGAHGKAAQTFSNIPAHDGRCIQMSWMRGGQYPRMPFNQQLSFPVCVELRSTADGPRLFRWPVREIDKLVFAETNVLEPIHVTPGHSFAPASQHDALDIQLSLHVSQCEKGGFRIYGNDLVYQKDTETLFFEDHEFRLPLRGGTLPLRLLIDRTSLEVFAYDGEFTASYCFLPQAGEEIFRAWCRSGEMALSRVCVRELSSIWD